MSSAEAESIGYSQLTPEEAAFLHPAQWDGESVGVCSGKVNIEPYKSVPMTAGLTMELSFADWGVERAITASQRGQFRPDQVRSFRPGDIFTPAKYIGATIIFDQSTLMARGPQYMLDTTEFPAEPPFRFPDAPPPAPYYIRQPRLHYLREQAAVARLGHRDEARNIRMSRMGRHAGIREYEFPVGATVVPETLTVGEVSHQVMSTGHEVLTRTHNVFVFPNMNPAG